MLFWQKILHSDRGWDFTDWTFVNASKSQGIIVSMSKAGCPDNNADGLNLQSLPSN